MSNNNHILNRLFTKQIINDLLKNNTNDIYREIIQHYSKDDCNASNRQIFTDVYNYMSENYRNEYFYQNTLLNKLLLGRHSIRTTTALSQIPIENSKADFVLINGKAVVYEIKTELDNFDRLSTQIDDYYKAFNYVYVVTCEQNFAKISEILKETNVGICILSKANTLQFKKEAVMNNNFLNHRTLFKILRKKEYEHIIVKCYGKTPETTPVLYYEECFKLFETIPLEKVYKLFLIELKKRNCIACSDVFKDVPYELRAIMYFSDISYSQYESLRQFLDASYKEVGSCITHI